MHKELKKAKIEMAEEKYRTIISLAQEYNSSKEDALSKLMEKCDISKELAEEKLIKYWGK